MAGVTGVAGVAGVTGVAGVAGVGGLGGVGEANWAKVDVTWLIVTHLKAFENPFRDPLSKDFGRKGSKLGTLFFELSRFRVKKGCHKSRQR